MEEGGEFVQLVVVQHPIPLAILSDVLGFQHPAVLSLFENEVWGLMTGHGSSREIRQEERAGRRREQDRPIGGRVSGGHAHGLDVGRRENAVLGLVAAIHIGDYLTVLRGAVGRSQGGSGRFRRG